MFEFNQPEYTRGFRDAEADIRNEGYEYASRHYGNLTDSNYAMGYRVAVNLYLERQLSD